MRAGPPKSGKAMEGGLERKGASLGLWEMRHFVLMGGKLFSYKVRGDNKKRGAWDVRGVFDVPNRAGARPHRFDIAVRSNEAGKSTLPVAAPSADMKQQWLTAIASASCIAPLSKHAQSRFRAMSGADHEGCAEGGGAGAMNVAGGTGAAQDASAVGEGGGAGKSHHAALFADRQDGGAGSTQPQAAGEEVYFSVRVPDAQERTAHASAQRTVALADDDGWDDDDPPTTGRSIMQCLQPWRKDF